MTYEEELIAQTERLWVAFRIWITMYVWFLRCARFCSRLKLARYDPPH